LNRRCTKNAKKEKQPKKICYGITYRNVFNSKKSCDSSPSNEACKKLFFYTSEIYYYNKKRKCEKIILTDCKKDCTKYTSKKFLKIYDEKRLSNVP